MKPREPIQPAKLLSPLDQCLDKLDCSFESKNTRKLLDDRERRERLLLLSIRALLDSRDAPTWLKSVSGHVLYVNPAFESCTGVQADEYCGRTAPEVWGPEVGAALEEGDRRARDAGRAVTTVVTMGESRVQIRNWPVYMADQLMGVAGEYL